MSGLLQGKVYYTTLPAHLRFTLAALADEADDEGHGVFIGQARLARKIGAGERTVRRNLGELRDLGYITRLDQPSPYGTDQYEVVVSMLPDDRSIWPVDPPANVAAPVTGGQDDRTPVTATTGHPRPPTREIPVSKNTRESFFTEFWLVAPRKVGKRAARAAFERALKRAPADTIIAGVVRYRDDPNRQDEFTAHPATWLNRDGWEDDPLPERRGKAWTEHPLDRMARKLGGEVNDGVLNGSQGSRPAAVGELPGGPR